MIAFSYQRSVTWLNSPWPPRQNASRVFTCRREPLQSRGPSVSARSDPDPESATVRSGEILYPERTVASLFPQELPAVAQVAIPFLASVLAVLGVAAVGAVARA